METRQLDSLKLSDSSGKAYHEQVVDQVANLVRQGLLRPLERLPSVRDVAGRLLVSPVTVRRAFEQLEAEGLVSRDNGTCTIAGDAALASRLRDLESGSDLLADAIHRAREMGVRDRDLNTKADAIRRTVELERARAVQLSMLPGSVPELEDFEIAVRVMTASEVGGDYYDFFPLESGDMRVVLGDATGHGLSAGLMVALARGCLHATEAASPEELLAKANGVLRSIRIRRLLMALICVDLGRDGITLSSAGMPPAYVFRSQSGMVEEILTPGLPLGNALSDWFPQVRVGFAPGDMLLLVTDGLPESEDPSGRMLGGTRIRDCMRQHADGSADELLDALLQLVSDWGASRIPNDDISLVAVRHRPSASTRTGRGS